MRVALFSPSQRRRASIHSASPFSSPSLKHLPRRRRLSPCPPFTHHPLALPTLSIGLGIARRLAQEGANVVLSSRKEKNLETALASLKVRSAAHRRTPHVVLLAKGPPSHHRAALPPNRTRVWMLRALFATWARPNSASSCSSLPCVGVVQRAVVVSGSSLARSRVPPNPPAAARHHCQPSLTAWTSL